MMLGLCVTPYAAIWDADVIVPFSNFVKALTILSEDKATIVLPYDGRVWDMTEYFSQIYRIHKDERLFGYYNCQCNFMNGYESVGGGFLVDISLYRQAGLENEHFIGWGPEDEERVSRLFILGHKVESVDGEMYHLHHWRGINSGSIDAEMALVTKREYAKICSMSKSELEAYIHSWDWIKETE